MKKTCKRFAEKIIGLIGALLIYLFMMFYMSKRRKHKKFLISRAKETIKIVQTPKRRKEKITVMGKILPKVSIMNCYPPNKYKVISKPAKWPDHNPFVYIDRIGKCVGTEKMYGAKLQFDTGETVTIPFENIEPAEVVKPAETPNTETQKYLPVVAQEVELVKNKYYKLIRKPTKWQLSCKYVGEIGKCLLVDDRGARLRFSDGNDISFPADVLEEAPMIDLSNVIPQGELTEDDIVHGGLYIIIKAPEKFGEGQQLVGRIGRAKWPNYRGVCLKFSDESAYVIPYDCIAKYTQPKVPNPIPTATVLNANSIVLGRKYKVKSVPGDWPDHQKRCAIGQFAQVKFATDVQKGAMMIFPNKMEKMVPFDCIEDLPRPTEDELITLIKNHPDKLLRIIKQINEVTKLKPVRDFCSTGLLPYCKEEAVTLYNVTVFGPQLPTQHSAALLLNDSGEASHEMMSHVVSMFNADEVKTATPVIASVTEVAAED